MPSSAQLAVKRRNESLGKRIETLLIKAHELWDVFDIDVAVFLKNNTQYCTYSSTEELIRLYLEASLSFHALLDSAVISLLNLSVTHASHSYSYPLTPWNWQGSISQR
jgi:hypothetical protein